MYTHSGHFLLLALVQVSADCFLRKFYVPMVHQYISHSKLDCFVGEPWLLLYFSQG